MHPSLKYLLCVALLFCGIAAFTAGGVGLGGLLYDSEIDGWYFWVAAVGALVSGGYAAVASFRDVPPPDGG